MKRRWKKFWVSLRSAWRKRFAKPRSRMLLAVVDGQATYSVAQAAAGVQIICKMPHGGLRLIAAHQALDQKAYWRLWEELNSFQQVEWEDGDLFDPAG